MLKDGFKKNQLKKYKNNSSELGLTDQICDPCNETRIIS